MIACLAWGSLVWDPRALPIRRQWFDDGPFGRVEFLRRSNDGRITLVLSGEADLVRLLWAPMDTNDLAEARRALKEREGLSANDWEKHVGTWSVGNSDSRLIPGMGAWALAHGVDSVVWTALGPRFEGDAPPTEDQVVSHLASLRGVARENAERYVRRAPRQIDTRYRRRVEAELGWSYQAAT